MEVAVVVRVRACVDATAGAAPEGPMRSRPARGQQPIHSRLELGPISLPSLTRLRALVQQSELRRTNPWLIGVKHSRSG